MIDTPNPSPQQPPLAGDIPAATLPPGLTPVPPPADTEILVTPRTEPPAPIPDAPGIAAPEEPPEEKKPGKKREILLGALLLLVVSGSLLFYFVQMRKQAEIPFQGSTSTDAYKDGLGVAGAGGANQPGGGALPAGLKGGVVQTDKDGVPVASVFQNGSGGYTVFGTNSPPPSTDTIKDIKTLESASAGMITNLDEFLNKGGAPIIFDAGNSRLAIIDNSVSVSSPNYKGLPTKTTDLNILSSKKTLVPVDLGRLVNVTYDKDTNPNTCATGCTGGSPLTSSQMTLGQALSEIAKGNLKGTFQLDFVDSPGSWLSFQIPGSTSTGGGSSNPPNNPPTTIPPASVTPTPTTPTVTSTPTSTPTITPTGMPTNTPTSTPTITPTATPSSPYCDASCESDSNCPGGLVCATVNGTKRCRNASCVSQSNCSCPASTLTPTLTPAPGTAQATTPKTPVAGGGDVLGIATAVGGVLLLLIGLLL